jgi:hypothetical protein
MESSGSEGGARKLHAGKLARITPAREAASNREDKNLGDECVSIRRIIWAKEYL